MIPISRQIIHSIFKSLLLLTLSLLFIWTLQLTKEKSLLLKVTLELEKAHIFPSFQKHLMILKSSNNQLTNGKIFEVIISSNCFIRIQKDGHLLSKHMLWFQEWDYGIKHLRIIQMLWDYLRGLCLLIDMYLES